jgi:hypothetical protein
MHAAVEGAFLYVMIGFVAFGLLCIALERARRKRDRKSRAIQRALSRVTQRALQSPRAGET